MRKARRIGNLNTGRVSVTNKAFREAAAERRAKKIESLTNKNNKHEQE
jgi:hypothetical protein